MNHVSQIWYGRAVAAYLAGVVIFVVAATALYWPTPEFAFLSDQSPLSLLSSAQLWTIAVLSLRLLGERAIPAATALWLFAAMVVLACDEQFMLHEQWKYGCFKWWSACAAEWVRELPMILVGVLGTATIAQLQRVLDVAPCRRLLWLSLAIGIYALGIDLLSWGGALARYEEGFEVAAEALFVAALLGMPSGRAAVQVHSV